MKGSHVVVAAIAAYILLGAYYLKAEDTPNIFYQKYLHSVKEGLSYEELQNYFSRRQKEETEKQIARYSKRMGKQREEVIQILSEINREIERCKERKLIGRMEKPEQADLQYVLKETCEETAPAQKEQIRLVKEGGHWKIDAIEVVL